MIIVEQKRKTQPNQRRDVRPTIPVRLYGTISRIAYITNKPIKDVGVSFCASGLRFVPVIDDISQHFKRDYWATNQTLYTGSPDQEKVSLWKGIKKRRITMSFSQADHDQLAHLAYSLDLTISSTTALLLDSAINNAVLVDDYITGAVTNTLDDRDVNQLNDVLKSINQNNPYPDEEFTLGDLINMILDNIKKTTLSVAELIKTWLGSYSQK